MFLLLACASPSDSSADSSSPGDTAPVVCGDGIDIGDCPPDVSLVDRDGVATSLLGLSGAATVISSEAGWCDSCQQQARDFETLYASRAADGLVVVTVLVENVYFEPAQASDAAEWADYLELTHPVLADPDGVFLPAYGGDISSAPFVFYVLDGDGGITFRRLQDEQGMLDEVTAAVGDVLGS